MILAHCYKYSIRQILSPWLSAVSETFFFFQVLIFATGDSVLLCENLDFFFFIYLSITKFSVNQNKGCTKPLSTCDCSFTRQVGVVLDR